MPGSSLWIIPPPSSPLNKSLQTLITTSIPPFFSSSETKTHDFIPHITITSQIDASVYNKEGAQPWLDNLDISSSSSSPSSPSPDQKIVISLKTLESQDPFFKKLFLKIQEEEHLSDLTTACRAAGVEKGDVGKAHNWVKENYMPHLSLMYAELKVSDVEKHLDAVRDECRKAARGLEADDHHVVCRGGSVVLVDTTKPIDQWSPIAERELPNLIWVWPWSSPSLDD